MTSIRKAVQKSCRRAVDVLGREKGAEAIRALTPFFESACEYDDRLTALIKRYKALEKAATKSRKAAAPKVKKPKPVNVSTAIKSRNDPARLGYSNGYIRKAQPIYTQNPYWYS